MKKNMKRAASVLLALLMSLSLLPTLALAAGQENDLAQLPDAVDGVVTLIQDVELTSRVTIRQDTTIDLNGKSITWKGSSAPDATDYGMIQVIKATLTIQDSKGGGSIICEATKPLSAVCAFGPDAVANVLDDIVISGKNMNTYAYRGGEINKVISVRTEEGQSATVSSTVDEETETAEIVVSIPTGQGGDTPQKITASNVAFKPEPAANTSKAVAVQPEKVSENTKSVNSNAVNTAKSGVETAANNVSKSVVRVKKNNNSENLVKTNAAAKAVAAAVVQVPQDKREAISETKVELRTELTDYTLKATSETNVVPNRVVYNVKPVAVIKAGGAEFTADLENADLAKENITFEFQLPVPSGLTNSNKVYVTHVHEDGTKDAAVEKTVENDMVTMTAASFSEFIITPFISDPDAACIAGGSLMLEGATIAQLYLVPNSGAVTARVAVGTVGRSYDVDLTKAKQVSIYGKEYILMRCPVYAHEINVPIGISLYDEFGNQMTVHVGAGSTDYDHFDYSIPDMYWAKVTDTSSPLYELGQAMMTYGDYAKRFSRKGDFAVSHNLTNPNLAADQLIGYQPQTSEDKIGITFRACYLVLGEETTLKVGFELDNEADNISGFSFLCDGKTLTPKKENDLYVVAIENIPAHKLNDMQTVTVKNQNGTYTVSCGVCTYAWKVLDTKGVDENLKDLVRAIYEYGQAASNYDSSRSQG